MNDPKRPVSPRVADQCSTLFQPSRLPTRLSRPPPLRSPSGSPLERGLRPGPPPIRPAGAAAIIAPSSTNPWCPASQPGHQQLDRPTLAPSPRSALVSSPLHDRPGGRRQDGYEVSAPPLSATSIANGGVPVRPFMASSELQQLPPWQAMPRAEWDDRWLIYICANGNRPTRLGRSTQQATNDGPKDRQGAT